MIYPGKFQWKITPGVMLAVALIPVLFRPRLRFVVVWAVGGCWPAVANSNLSRLNSYISAPNSNLSTPE